MLPPAILTNFVHFPFLVSSSATLVAIAAAVVCGLIILVCCLTCLTCCAFAYHRKRSRRRRQTAVTQQTESDSSPPHLPPEQLRPRPSLQPQTEVELHPHTTHGRLSQQLEPETGSPTQTFPQPQQVDDIIPTAPPLQDDPGTVSAC